MAEVTYRRSWTERLKYYFTLAYGAAGSLLALGLLVCGTLLVGLAIPVFLSGLGLVDISTELTTGPLIICGLILGVAGGFCVGVASESPLGRGRRLRGFRLWEIGIGRTLASLAIGFGLLFVYRFVLRVVGDVPEPLLKGVEVLRAVGRTALVEVPLIAVPLSLLIRWTPTTRERVKGLDVPAMYVVWLLSALFALT